MQKFLTIATVLCALWANVSRAAESVQPIGAFPSEWLDFTADLYPISQQPRPIQWQAWLAVQIATRSKGELILIESHEASRESAEKLLRYLVDHHKFPENRFIVTTRHTPGWKGWVTVRSEKLRLPASSPAWEIPMIRTSLASPLRPEEAASLYRYSKRPEKIGNTLYRIRPGIGIQWFNLQTDPRRADRWTASWIGVRGSGESTLFDRGPYEIGATASYYTSLSGLNDQSLHSHITTMTLGPYFTYHFKPSVIGMAQARLDTGFFGTWRNREDAGAFAPPVRAALLKATLSTSFDESIRLGASFGYVAQDRGVLQAGGYLRHRIFSTTGHEWDATFALDLSLARLHRGAGDAPESWSTVQAGFIGSL